MNLQQLADENPELLAAQLAPSLRDKYTLLRDRPTFTTATADDCRAWDQEREEWPDPLSSLALACRSLHAVAVHDIIWRGFFEEQRFVFGKGVSGAELSRRWRQAGHPWFASPKPSIFAPSADFPSLQTNVCNWLAKNLNDIEGLGHLPPHLADAVRTEALGDLPPARLMDGAGLWRQLSRATKILEERHIEHVTTTEKTGAVWDVPHDVQQPNDEQPDQRHELALLPGGLLTFTEVDGAGNGVTLWEADLKTGYGDGPPGIGHVIDLPYSAKIAHERAGFGRRAFCLKYPNELEGDEDQSVGEKFLVAKSEEEAAAWVKKIELMNRRYFVADWKEVTPDFSPDDSGEDLSGVAQRLQITVESD